MATIRHHPSPHPSPSPGPDRRPRRHSLDYSSLPSSPFKHHPHHPTPTLTLSSPNTTPSFSLLPPPSATTATSAPRAPSSLFDALEARLASGDLRGADEETRRLLIALAGEAAVKRGYVFFSEVQFIPAADLRAIDDLWQKHSEGKFGYSVQKKIWLRANKDFTKFFIKVGWMKKLDTEVEQYNYRAFPSEFMWELSPPTKEEIESGDISKGVPPEGHLPLTNALRGTQLLACILTHPAFADDGDGDGDGGGVEERESDRAVVAEDQPGKKKSRLAALRDRLFKPNYSF